jgi:hypothetical protein
MPKDETSRGRLRRYSRSRIGNVDMSQLPINELTLHRWLRKHYYPDLRLHGSQYSSYDAWSYEFRIQIELKVRATHYDELILEKTKYDALIRLADMNNLRPVYICATPLGVWEFNLRTIPLNWVIMDNLPKTTYWPANAPIAKTVALLPISEAKRLGEASNARVGGVMYANR